MNACKNRYYKYSRITEDKFRQILRGFALDLTATETARQSGISVRSVNSIFLKLRQRIVDACEAQAPRPVDDDARGLYVNGNANNPLSQYLAFGVYRLDSTVYTEMAPLPTRQALQRRPRRHIHPSEIVRSEGWKGYDGVVDVGADRIYRTAANTDGESNFGLVSSFWDYSRRRFQQFNGIHKHTFYLHLKESEFRFNCRRSNVYRALLKMLRDTPLS